jgi:nitroreductase
MASEAESRSDRIEFLRGLRAIREYTPEAIPRDALADVLEVARWSGSGSNRQPWELIVVRDREALRALSEVEGYAGHLAEAAVGIVLVMAGDSPQIETFDEGRLSERIMLAAAAHGVGSSIGWFVGSGQDAVKRLLGIPEGRLVRTAISMGYADEEARAARPRRKEARKPLREIVYEERYGRVGSDW